MSLLESLKIPVINKQRVPVKTLIGQLQTSTDNRRLIETHVSSIYLVSLLNEQTIRFRAFKDDNYSYQAIYVLSIKLKKSDRLMELSQQLHSAFPEPTVLLYECGDKEWISLAPKHINKIDETKTVLDDVIVEHISGDILQYLNLSQLSAADLKDYYFQIINLVYKMAVYNVVKVFPKQELDYKSIIKQYQQINASINTLKEQYKKATMKAEQLDIDDQLYDEEMKKIELINRIRGVSSGTK